MTALAVVVFGALGGLIRSWLRHMNGRTHFRLTLPWGTLVANLVGCVALGAVAGRSGLLATGLGAGFAGAASTWSSFIADLDALIEGPKPAAGAYLALTLLGGAAATMTAMALTT